ncbi:MAG: enoyl-CoA hydratase/isomerase family protein [Bacteroidota bacterium]
MDKYDTVHWKREGDIGIFSLSNGKENYLEVPDFIQIEKLREWTEEPGLKGVIIHGAGRNFSAGANLEKLNELAKNYKLLSERITQGKNLLNFIEHLEIPVIAAINGVCFGGGLEIALACSMRIASKNALFAFPEINHGLIPGLGGAYRSVNLVKNKAFEIILNGDMLNAEKALKIGLIDDIANDKDAFEYAHRKMLSMTEGRSPELIRFAMKALKNADLLSKEDALREETEMFCKLATNLKI